MGTVFQNLPFMSLNWPVEITQNAKNEVTEHRPLVDSKSMKWEAKRVLRSTSWFGLLRRRSFASWHPGVAQDHYYG
jgi:hypothetical protein